MAKIALSSNKNWYGFLLFGSAILLYGGYQWHNSIAPEPKEIPQSRAHTVGQANQLFVQGNKLYKEGKLTEAIKYYHESLAVDPMHEQAHISTSLAAAKLGNVDHAIEHVQKALAINKNYIAGYIMLGKYQEDKKLFDEAKKSYRYALSLNSNLFEGNLFLSRLLTREGSQESSKQAIELAQKAVNVQPKHKDALMALADAHLMAGHPIQAREQYQITIDNHPTAYDAHMGLGKTYERERAIGKAIPHYQKSVEINPNYANGHISLAGAYFMQGNLKDGFQEYEWRWKQSNMPNLANKWDGSNPKGKKIIVLSENGLGDIFQYVRFAKLLKEKGAYVILHVPNPLTTLFKLSDYADEVITVGESNPEHDYVTSMQSIPYLLGIDRHDLPNKAYLNADNNLTNEWKQKLSQNPNFKVGICWTVGDDSYLAADQKRSLDLTALKPLADLEGVSFYSLQKGSNTEQQIKNAPFKIQSFGNDLDTDHGAFMDTAAIMKNMDLVISVDTSVAHLAGALAVPTWILLPYAADVRWMVNTNDSIWYPSVKLFRQPKAGNWKSAISSLKKQLVKKLAD